MIVYQLIPSRGYLPELGEVFSLVCGEIQVIVQESIKPQYAKNHGELVKTVLQMLKEYRLNDKITEQCSICIMKQFAQGIPIHARQSSSAVVWGHTFATSHFCLFAFA